MAYSFQTKNFPGDTFTELLGINNAGLIVGFHGQATNMAFFIPPGGTFTPITAPNATQTDAVGINNNNLVVGFFTDNVPPATGVAGTTHGFMASPLTPPGNVTIVDEPGTNFNQLLGVNDSGEFAGYSSLDPAGQMMQLAYTRAPDGTYTQLDNANHTAVLPTNVNSQATGVDNTGDVVGFYMPTATTSNGFLLSAGKLTMLTFPGSTFTQALGINNHGQVVGFYNDTAGVTHGFVYSNGFYTNVDAPGATATTINGINDNDQVVGFDTTGTTTNGITATLPFATVTDNTNHVGWQQALDVYTGPLSFLQFQFIDINPENLNIATTQDNVFLHSGPGDDALQVHGGQNVLDGGTGSNFLVGGSGIDTFFVDDRNATADIWSTVANFHSGDSATIYGITPQDFAGQWFNGQGAGSFTGLTTHISKGGHTASLTLAGFSTADLSNGRLSVTFGTDPDSNSPSRFVHAA